MDDTDTTQNSKGGGEAQFRIFDPKGEAERLRSLYDKQKNTLRKMRPLIS